jgi:ribulose-5-phosphate 4-epimerase/fuculose-1-phosphate aldolase
MPEQLSTPSNAHLRKTIIEACRILDHNRLVHGYGHVSARCADGKTILITPRKALLLVRSPREIVEIDLEGNVVGARSPKAGKKGIPSQSVPPVEFYLHMEIYRARPEVKAICRTHGVFALTLSVLGRKLGCVHELAVRVGREVPLYDSAELIATAEEGRRAAQTLGQGRALLLRGNGAVIVGASVEEAVVNAILLETSAEVQWRASCIDEPVWIAGEDHSGEYARLAKREYEAVRRPWDYYLAKSRGK